MLEYIVHRKIAIELTGQKPGGIWPTLFLQDTLNLCSSLSPKDMISLRSWGSLHDQKVSIIQLQVGPSIMTETSSTLTKLPSDSLFAASCILSIPCVSPVVLANPG